jgi:hypothetical protein
LRIIVSLIVLWGFLLSAGCRANPVDVEAPPEIPPSTVAEPTSTPIPVSPPQGDPQMTPSSTSPANTSLQSLIDTAISDLAQRLSIPAPQIKLVETSPVTWPDSSLGCPQPGMVYAQVLTPGYLILLEADGKIYEYHANRDTYVSFCENPSPPVPGTPADT